MRRLLLILPAALILSACVSLQASPTPLSGRDAGTATQHAANVATMDAVGTKQGPAPTVAHAASTGTANPTPTGTPTPTPPGGPMPTLPPTPTIVPQPFTTDGGALPEGALARIGIGYILAHAASPDGSRIAVGTSTGVYVYQTADLTRAWRRYTSYPIGFLAWSPDGSRLVTGEDNTFNNYAEPALWDAATGTKIADLTGAWYGASWSPDGASLAASDGGEPSRLLIYDGHSGQLRQSATLENTGFLSTAVWSPDGKTIAITDAREFYVETHDILLWDVATNRLAARLATPESYTPLGILFSPDGSRVTARFYSGDNQAPVWDTALDQVAFALPLGEENSAEALAWSPDGAEIARPGSKTLTISSPSTGATLREFSVRGDVLAWSPDGQRIAIGARGWAPKGQTGGSAITILDAQTGTEQNRLTVRASLPYEGQDTPVIGWLPDGRRLAISTRESLTLWDTLSNQTTGLTTLGEAPQMRWLPGSEILALTSLDQGYQLWDVSSGEPTVPVGLNPDFAALFGQDDPGTANDPISIKIEQGIGVGDGPVGGGRFYDGSRLTLTDNRTGAILFQKKYDSVGITSTAWSPDKKRIALGFGSGEMRGAGYNWITIMDPYTGAELLTLSGHTGDVSAMRFSPDGRRLASTSMDASVIIWNVDR